MPDPAAHVLAPTEKFRFTIYCKSVEQVALNVVHYQVISIAGTSTTVGQFLTDFEAPLAAALKPLLNNATAYMGTTIQLVHPNTDVAVVSQANAGLGTGAGDLLPRQTAGFIKKRAVTPGRRRSGRIYVPFPSESHSTTEGHPSAAYQALLLTYGDLITKTFSTGVGANTAIVSGIIYRRTAPANSSEILGISISDRWATQRRRGDFGRPNAMPF